MSIMSSQIFHSYVKQQAFTLIELLVTVAIVGIISTVAVPAYTDYSERIKVEQAIVDISKIEMRIEGFIPTGSSHYPDSLAEIGMNDLLDPWGRPYHYLNLSNPNIPGINGKARKDKNLVPVNSDFDLYSLGKDGSSVAPFTASASKDDVVRANNGRFVGLASKY